MDSLTQIVLGGCVAATCVPAAHRRRAALVGAVLGTLPDLDGIPLALMGADVVTQVTWHRGPSHSLPVLAVLGWLLWLLLRRHWAPVREAPRPWLAAILLALLTHPLLDAFTVYGTQLLWPLPMNPVMWSSVFIIDPAYTLPLLAAWIVCLRRGAAPTVPRWLAAGLVLSSAYLGWTLVAKSMVDHDARATLAASPQTQSLHNAPMFSVPMPFNTLLWRVVVLTPDGFLEGYRSLAVDKSPMTFTHHRSNTAAMQQVAGAPSVARLLWFTSGFMKAEPDAQDRLVLSDLRMGAEPQYIFRYRVAQRGADGQWQAGSPEQAEGVRDLRQLGWVWRRLWREDEAPALPLR